MSSFEWNKIIFTLASWTLVIISLDLESTLNDCDRHVVSKQAGRLTSNKHKNQIQLVQPWPFLTRGEQNFFSVCSFVFLLRITDQCMPILGSWGKLWRDSWNWREMLSKHLRDKNKSDESLPFHSLNFVKAEEQLRKNRWQRWWASSQWHNPFFPTQNCFKCGTVEYSYYFIGIIMNASISLKSTYRK